MLPIQRLSIYYSPALISALFALWIGHESTTMTHMYVEADLAMNEVALSKLQQPDTKF